MIPDSDDLVSLEQEVLNVLPGPSFDGILI